MITRILRKNATFATPPKIGMTVWMTTNYNDGENNEI
jgi:hypothetical protein